MNPRWQINKTENECVNERIYNYILSGQKFIKNAKKWFVFMICKPKACGQAVLPDIFSNQKWNET